MNAPDVQKHLQLEIGRLVLELATAKAVIEQQEKSSSVGEARGTRPEGEVPHAPERQD